VGAGELMPSHEVRRPGRAGDPDATWPTVSVLMPCYNAERYIADAIRSVLDQDYPGTVELIIVDDGSSDGSLAVASGFPGARVLSQRNQGPAAARNLAYSHAIGQLIAFIDADDQWLTGALRARVEYLQQHPDVGVVFADFSYWTPDALPKGQQPSEVLAELPATVSGAARSGWLYPEILLDPIVHIITAVVRREVFDSIGVFDPGLRIGEDYDLLIRMSQRHRFGWLQRPVARYRVHPGSTIHVQRSENIGYDVIQRAIRTYGTVGPGGRTLDARLLARRLRVLCFNHAYGHYWHGNAQTAARGFAAAVRHDPTDIKTWIYALMSACKAAFKTPAAGRS
jgi:glycosyltransferase involved in cell wall biosynthesis